MYKIIDRRYSLAEYDIRKDKSIQENILKDNPEWYTLPELTAPAIMINQWILVRWFFFWKRWYVRTAVNHYVIPNTFRGRWVSLNSGKESFINNIFQFDFIEKDDDKETVRYWSKGKRFCDYPL